MSTTLTLGYSRRRLACGFLFCGVWASVFLSALPVAWSDGTRLSRIQYRLFGREVQSVGELSYQGERVSLRLFDERLGDYYTLYVEYADLVDVSLMPVAESEKILKQREQTRTRKIAERDAERARRKRTLEAGAAETEAGRPAARPRRRAGSVSKGDLPGGRSRSPRADSREAAVAGRVVPMTPGDPQEALAELDEVLQPFKDRIDAGETRIAELAEVVGSVLSRETPPREALRLRGELQSLDGSFEKLTRSYERRLKDKSRIAADVSGGKLDSAATRQRVDLALRQMVSLERKLKTLESNLARQSERITSLPAPAPVTESATVAPAASPTPGGPKETLVVPAVVAEETSLASSPAAPAQGSRDATVSATDLTEWPPPPPERWGISHIAPPALIAISLVLAGLFFIAARIVVKEHRS